MRRNSIFFIIFLFSFSLIISTSVFGKEGKGCKRGGGMSPYKKETFTTIKGNIKSIDTVFNKAKQKKGLHLKVKTSSGDYIVHVCPQWYADKQKIQFSIDELLTVSGSTFIRDNEQNIYAATIIRSSSETLKLRNPDTGDGLWGARFQDEKMSKRRQKR